MTKMKEFDPLPKTSRREVLRSTLAAGFSVAAAAQSSAPAAVVKYVRYESRGRTSYGIWEGDLIHELRGSIFEQPSRTGVKWRLSEVRLLTPCVPRLVLAAGLNYRSHLGSRPVPKKPEFFWKTADCLVEPEGKILIPPGAENVHYEGEMVVVIGKTARNVAAEEARNCVFGVTCGNDISERNWQRDDLQWWRAKASATFGPLGPAIARGLDFGNLKLETKVNGQVKQSENTRDLIYDVPTMISFLSRHVTLQPGDILFTGTPQTTSAMKPGDVVEVSLEGAGVLRNVVA